MVKWPVLHNRPTVSSLHRSVNSPSSPGTLSRDSLDLHLASCYQHNLDVFPDTSDAIRHPSRLLRVKTSTSPIAFTEPQGITYGGLTARPSIHSVKLGISANHIAQTNAGFSRKLDGTFYSL